MYGENAIRCRRIQMYIFFFLMLRRPPRSTLDRSSAASDVYKRQILDRIDQGLPPIVYGDGTQSYDFVFVRDVARANAVSYTHLRAHETVLDLVCRLLLEKNN